MRNLFVGPLECSVQSSPRTQIGCQLTRHSIHESRCCHSLVVYPWWLIRWYRNVFGLLHTLSHSMHANGFFPVLIQK